MKTNTSSLQQSPVKSTKLGGKIWFSAVLFGLVGQIAWVVENMYFATFAQDIFHNSGQDGLAYTITTLMVIFSAITATVTTIFAGGWCDKSGKRKPFVAWGYIAWGVTIMLFAAIPMSATTTSIAGIAAMLIIFDCVMTFAGSTANDAAFNAWITDVTDTTNRGKLNSVLSMLPVFATIIVFIGLGGLYDSKADSNWLFFVILGIIPMLAGIIALFTMKDSKKIVKQANTNKLKETFYGFRKDVIKSNKMLYVCLFATCILGIAQQTFFSYLINFVQNTLRIGDRFVIPLAVVILGSAVLTGVAGVLYDKFGRKHFYAPLLCVVIAATLLIYLMTFMPQAAWLPLLYVAGIFMLGSILALGGALSSTFQDYIPKGYEGRFQGVRMCFTVLVPMIIGPLITLIIGLNDVDTGATGFAPPFEMFLAASIIAVLAFKPIFFVRKDSDRLRKLLIAKRDEEASQAISNEIDDTLESIPVGIDGTMPVDCDDCYTAEQSSDDNLSDNEDDR